MRKPEGEYLDQFVPYGRTILAELLANHVVDGELQFAMPDVLEYTPSRNPRRINEIVTIFAASDKLPHASKFCN